MNKDKWHKGPPPSIGWWPASYQRRPEVLRWWNGKEWSIGAGRFTMNPGYIASVVSPDQSKIEWRHRPDDWPEHSRT